MKNFEIILEEWKQKTKTSLLICVSMLTAGAVMLIVRQIVGWLFICAGIALAGSLYYKKMHMDKQLSEIADIDAFCRQFNSKDTLKLELLGLAITPDYAVLTLPYLKIYPLRKMAKFEVGLGESRKALFLTDKNGTRHKIAETMKGDALQKEFDQAYEEVRRIFNERAK